MLSLKLVTVLLLIATSSAEFVWKHHNNEELPLILQEVHEKCPNITRVYELSEPSVKNVPLYVIEFAEKPGIHQPYKPEVKYVGNIHGNEVLGRELLLGLADYLCEAYLKHDRNIRALVHNTRIHLLPAMNPDGWQLSTDTGTKDYLLGRNNNHSVDLNRNFPDLDTITFEFERQGINHNNHLLKDVTRLAAPLEPETRSVMRWILGVPFVLSAALHGGDLVANYPYDESRSGAPVSEYSASPDDLTFRELAMTYASAHADMASNNRPGCHVTNAADSSTYNFGKQGGVTNGAAWYSLRGGMQDFNYLATNAFEVTLELGCEKYPPESELQNEWQRNKEALIAYLWKAHSGVKGIVTDDSGFLKDAVISVVNITGPIPKPIRHDVTTGVYGDYYRLLTAGHYEVTASHPGYFPISRVVTVPEHAQRSAVVLNFRLEPTTSWFDDESPFGVFQRGRRDSQPRIYKRSLYQRGRRDSQPRIYKRSLYQRGRRDSQPRIYKRSLYQRGRRDSQPRIYKRSLYQRGRRDSQPRIYKRSLYQRGRRDSQPRIYKRSLYQRGRRDSQPRIYKRSLYQKVAASFVGDKQTDTQ